MFSILAMMGSGMEADVATLACVHCAACNPALVYNPHIDSPNKSTFFNTIYLPTMLCFNLHWLVSICTFEFLILRGQSQATLKLRACVSLGYLP
jgi:hypothetical protein